MLLCINSSLAFEKVVVNSADWRDVYSSMLYASLINKRPGLFLTSSQDGTLILNSIPRNANGTFIISSKSRPYIVNYKGVMDSQGYTGAQEIVSNSINLDLAKKLSTENHITQFIIIDDAYGYNALSSASYAIIENSYVLFANDRNIGAVSSFLAGVNPTKILIIGQVDESVKTQLARYNPETINSGDRFDNNIQIVKRYEAIKHSKQIVMSNGEFIEASIMSGDNPVVFIGKSTVPPQVVDYIKSSEIQVAVLIGNELVNSATAIRRQLGISVFVKFAQGARNPQGAIASVEDLDKFPMPSYDLALDIQSIMYNKATNALWVTYRNSAGVGEYLQGTITISDNGQPVVVGDQDPIFIDKNQYKTIIYDAITLQSDNLTAKIYTLFGEGKKSMENVLQGSVNIETVEILDSSSLNVTDVSYDKRKQAFIISVKNIGSVDVYTNAEVLDIFVNGEYLTVASTDTKLLGTGKSTTLSVPIVLTDSDIQNNPLIKIRTYYGERQNSLIKTIYGEYAFKFTTFDIVFYALILLIILLVLLIVFGRKKCPECKTRNFRFSKVCRKCRHNLNHINK